MTKITQISDRGAATAWSPLQAFADVIAVGGKDSGGIGFEDTGADLEIYDLQLSNASQEAPKLLGTVKCASRFTSLGWSNAGSLSAKYSMGLIAGGMENGSVHIFDPKKILASQPAVVASYQHPSSGPVKALQFNSLNQLQLATGGSDGQVLIANLNDPTNPVITKSSDTQSQSASITSLAWNTQVAHIVASAAGDGSVAVWDLKSRKQWCELRDAAGQAISDMAWNPSEGLHLLTACSDDRNPVIKLWDLRSSTSMPLATMSGHSQGILNMSWCPHDDHLLLTCGKDSRTILWDLYTMKPIADVPNDVQPVNNHDSGSQDLFAAGGLASSQQRRYQVEWSPIKRGVASTCSLDRKVQAHSILSLASQCGRPPKWLRPSSSVSCAFGATVVSCGAIDRTVRVRTVPEQPDLVKKSLVFETEWASSTASDFCLNRAARAKTAGDRQIWSFMQVMFETNARQEILKHLGFDAEKIAEAASNFKDGGVANGVGNLSLEEHSSKHGMSKAAENMVTKALLVGNFEAAVDCCFENGNLGDALVLASCGGGDLWTKTQQRYFEAQSSKRPFLSIVSAIVHSQLGELVQASDPEKWQETLSILSTYAKSEEFPSLCVELGDLLTKAGDNQSASLCYMCALSLERAVKYWRKQLETSSKMGSRNLPELHEFIVKVHTFFQAVGQGASLDEENAGLFTYYAVKLAEQGLLESAAKYARGDSYQAKVLRDRLYRSRASPKCLAAMGNQPPEFPFSMADIKKSRQPTVSAAASNPSTQRQGYSQSTASYQATTNSYQQGNAAASSQYQQVNQVQQAQATSTALPPGWVALQDPSSGNTYYANQTTGETTWDRPAAPIDTSATAAIPARSNGSAPNTSSGLGSNSAHSNKLASKYGDGFVSSASHPELATQYGNVGTSNPYSNTDRPGTAKVSAGEKAPVSGSLDMDKIRELKEEHFPIRDILMSLVDALKQTDLSSGDKRLISESEKGVAILLKRLARGDVPDAVAAQVLAMSTAVQSYDWRGAQSNLTSLVSNEWKEHKDWLKGVKALLQLTTKKFAS